MREVSLLGEPMVVALGKGKKRPVCQSLRQRKVRRMALMQEGARRGYATRTKRRCNAPKVAVAREARNESGLTRKNIHGIIMVVPKYDKTSHGYHDLY